MKAEVAQKVGGKTYTLAMPFGALEEVEKINPYPEELVAAFQARLYKPSELRAVLEAGIKWGNAEIGVEDLINAIGRKAAADLAARLMMAGFEDDAPGKSERPGARKANGSDSARATS